jgi:hypothetical protein
MLSSSVQSDAERAAKIVDAVGRLDGWLESMRSAWGYAGPIVHWWESCLIYCGPMLDWRYEGILSGYVRLYEATGQLLWLERARTAAHDIVRGQLPDGSYRNSSFQFGAMERGTPHEAAVDVGLLLLARMLRTVGDPSFGHYVEVAERNLDEYHLKRLWNGSSFRDQTWSETVVANKNATTIEALLLLEELTGRDLSSFILSAAELILKAQVRTPGPRFGGTVHLGTDADALVIGFYTARCVSTLIQLFERFGDHRYDHAASDAVDFLISQTTAGGVSFGYYKDGRPITNPTWISPAGEVLRALLLAARHRTVPQRVLDQLIDLLLEAQLPSGGIPTARGVARRGLGGQPPIEPEFRDVIPVVGWCDKAFRALALLVNGPVSSMAPCSTDVRCTWKASSCRYREEVDYMCLERENDGKILYRWRKGEAYPEVFDL